MTNVKLPTDYMPGYDEDHPPYFECTDCGETYPSEDQREDPLGTDAQLCGCCHHDREMELVARQREEELDESE